MFCPECGEVMAPGRFDGQDAVSRHSPSKLSWCVDLLLRRRTKPAQSRAEG